MQTHCNPETDDVIPSQWWGVGALTSEAPRKSVMPTAGLLVDSHSGLSSRA